MDTPHRHEKKYRLPLRAVPALRADLAALLSPDPHCSAAGGAYAIRSLYFESWTQSALREKLAGLHQRFKLRVRGYPPLDRSSPLVAEIKRKHGEVVIKERTPLTANELDLLLASRHGALLAARPDDATLRRFVAAKAIQGSVAPLIVEYRREAFEHPARHVYLRATIDSEFWAAADGDLFAARPHGHRFGTGEAILEIELGGAPPTWLGALVRKYRLELEALSKFGFACARTYARPRPQ